MTGCRALFAFALLSERDENEVNTDINNTITAADDTRQFDACAKRIMAHRSILGNILARLLPVYRGMDPQDVAELILPDINVSTVPVDPGCTNIATATETGDRIIGFNTEDKEINEGETRFDLIFYAREPNGVSRIIINIELQKAQPTDYPLVNRGIYYACRAISSQKERDFKKNQYGRIKNTYSVWICLNKAENSIYDYHWTKDRIMGTTDWKDNLDLMHVYFIGVSNDLPERNTQNELHRLLCALYSDRMTAPGILNILEREYNIPITDQMDEEVNDMCNLGEGIAERAEARGVAQGVAQGIAQGVAQGVQQGRSEAISECVVNLYNNNYRPEQIASGLNQSLDNILAILVRKGLVQP